jgi:rod shape-determining protein MreC
MQKRGTIAGAFFLLLLITLTILFAFSLPFMQPIRGAIEWVFLPLQRVVHSGSAPVRMLNRDEQIRKLEQENFNLRKKLVDQTKYEADMKALRDQFAVTSVPSRQLLPAAIIGSQGFIPGKSLPKKLVVDKGERNGIKVGMVVISGESVIGSIKNTSAYLSEVQLVMQEGSLVTVVTQDTQASGVVKGSEAGMLLDNVVLSETLEIGDSVVTKGDVEVSGKGYPKGLLIGKITSVNKKASELFQTATVESLVDITKLSTVFVIAR